MLLLNVFLLVFLAFHHILLSKIFEFILSLEKFLVFKIFI